MREFSITGGGFLLDGAPFRLLSGAMHYFRVHPGRWDHRLAMLRAMGLNTVETYVPWNLHEPRPGDFRRLEELGDFLEAAARHDLLAIVRPGPYICAEWENGGLPAWLTHLVGERARTSDATYLERVDHWFDQLIPRVAEHQITQGGNVIMVQVENEYGSYGSDSGYLLHLVDLLRDSGIEVPLFTSDGPEDHMLTGGTVPGVLATVNFGSDPEAAIAALRRHRPDGPAVCMELWLGWFDHWGSEHTARDAADAAGTLERLLKAGGSVNIYMAHGGTSFGTWAGANHDGTYRPTVTSYDYDAPISEDGRPTEKYWRFREILSRYNTAPEPPPAPVFLPPSRVGMTGSAALFDVLPAASAATPMPPSFEDLGLVHGLVRYRVDVPGPRRPYPLTVDGLHDRAHVYVDGMRVATLSRDGDASVDVAGPARVELLVESLGRVNYGTRIGERKGIVGGIRHERQYLHGVSAQALSLEELPAISFQEGTPCAAPAFFRGSLEVEEPADAFLALPGWEHGYVWVNGFGLGRYSARGPQRALYLPGPVLRRGANEIVVLELDAVGDPAVEIRASPDLG